MIFIFKFEYFPIYDNDFFVSNLIKIFNLIFYTASSFRFLRLYVTSFIGILLMTEI